MSERHPHFDPLRAPTKRARVVLLLTGPLLWLLSLVIVAVAIGRTDLIAWGLGFAAASFLFGIVLLPFVRAHRVREEDASAADR